MAKKRDNSDLFSEEPVNEKSADFGALFEQSLSRAGRSLNVGDQLRGEILSIGKDEAFVATGTPTDAIILTADLLDEKKALKYKVGDIIDFVILRVRPEEIRATRKGSKSAPVDMDNLEDAFDMELPVEGKVTEVVKGGYRVSIQGQAAFCPISQMGLKPIQDTAEMVGKKFEFIITQFDPRGRNIVVSRRKLLEAQKAENAGLWVQEHSVGDVLSGVVTRTEQYGAFVEVAEGVEGLVHVSEIGYTRLKHASEGVRVGDPVQVKILKIEDSPDQLKISLSIKQAGGAGDPWLMVPQIYPVGTVVDGVVEKKEAFGIFIMISQGITGLLPRSKWRDATDPKPYENAKKGDVLKVAIGEIKFDERKISLDIAGDGDDQSWREHQAATASSKSFGGLADAFKRAQFKKS